MRNLALFDGEGVAMAGFNGGACWLLGLWRIMARVEGIFARSCVGHCGSPARSLWMLVVGAAIEVMEAILKPQSRFRITLVLIADVTG